MAYGSWQNEEDDTSHCLINPATASEAANSLVPDYCLLPFIVPSACRLMFVGLMDSMGVPQKNETACSSRRSLSLSESAANERRRCVMCYKKRSRGKRWMRKVKIS